VKCKMLFEGWQGTAKPDIDGYVVPNFRCEVTKRPLGKLDLSNQPFGHNTPTLQTDRTAVPWQRANRYL